MGTVDELVDLMFRWLEKRERCAKQLRELARELEVLREKCNASECVGNSVSVVGGACLVGAGVATLCTGGLAAPFLGFLGAAYTGVGLTISLVTKLTEHLLSSKRTKKAQLLESESNRIAERIKHLFEQLRAECRKESFNADEDELEQRVIAKILAAIARRSGQKWTVCDSIDLYSGSQISVNALLLKLVLPTVVVAGLAGILVFFAFRASGKKVKLLFAEAGQPLIQKGATTGLKTALKGGGMVVGGAVGLAFSLPEAIDSWKEMIEKNHVTEASQSMRDIADAMDKMCQTLRNQFDEMKAMIPKMQREYERLQKERLQRERLFGTDWFPRGQQEHGNPKMAGMALCFLFFFLFLFKGPIFCKTDKDMSLSSPEGSIQWPETESHMGLRHEVERQGDQTKQTGNELEKGSKQTGSELEKGSKQTGNELEKGSKQTGSELEKGSKQTGNELEKGSKQTGSEIDKGSKQTGSEIEKGSKQTGSEIEKGSKQTGSEIESIQRAPPFIRAALLNVHSMNKNTSNILELITSNQLDVLFTTETWLKLDTADDVLRKASPQNFRFFSHVSEVIGHRGAAIQFSTELHGIQIRFDNMETFECVVTVLQHNEWEEPVVSINLYRPPKKTLTRIRKFLEEFQELLKEVSKNYNNIIVTGDFNIWVDCDWRTDADELDWFLRVNRLDLYPREPTYRSGHFLDLVLTRNVEISDVKVRDDKISDHYTVYFNWRPEPKSKRKQPEEEGKRLKKG